MPASSLPDAAATTGATPTIPRVVHLRLVVPPDLVEPVLAVLRETASVYAIVHLPDVAERPRGDLVTCEVAREDASIVVGDLCRLGLDDVVALVLESIDTAVSETARRLSMHRRTLQRILSKRAPRP